MFNTTICEVVSNSNVTFDSINTLFISSMTCCLFHNDQVGEFSFPINFGVNGECKNLPRHNSLCCKIGGSGSLLHNTPNHYQVSVSLLISSHIAMVYFHVKISVTRQMHVKVFHIFLKSLKGILLLNLSGHPRRSTSAFLSDFRKTREMGKMSGALTLCNSS